MQPIISVAESRRLDEIAAEPVDVLMRRAGLAVALRAVGLGVGYGNRVVVLAGTGNNGGDGYIAAAYLARRGVAVEVQALGEPGTGAARSAATFAEQAGVEVVPAGRLTAPDLLIDAAFGSGFRGELPPALVAWSAAGQQVLAVDVPSGLDGDTGAAAAGTFTAAATVTFQARKTGHLIDEGPERCGAVTVADIGLPNPSPVWQLVEEVDAPRPQRPRTAHKWSSGSVLVVGGAPGLSGAAALAGTAALRAGAGAVALACPQGLATAYEAAGVDLLVAPTGTGDVLEPGDAASILELAERFDALVLGPGLGPVEPDLVRRVLAGWPGGLVLDADGLNAVTPADIAERSEPTVLTPHAGEFSRLTGGEASWQAAGELARATGAVVLLKGNPTFVMGDEQWVVTTGGPELATIGTGDVLAGMIGAYWAAGLPTEVAVRSAAFRHGALGRALAADGPLLASRLAEEVGR